MFHQKFFKLTVVQEDTLPHFFSLLKKAKKVFFDTETTGLYVRWFGRDYIVGYTFAFEDEVSKDVFYVPVRHIFEGTYEENNRFKIFKPSFLKLFPDFCPEKFAGEYYNVDAYDFAYELKQILYEGGKELIAHNISYDLHSMANEDIDIPFIFQRNKFQDTQIMVHTIDENVEKNLESVTKLLFKVEKSHYTDTIKTVTKEEKLSQGLPAAKHAGFQHVQIPIGAQYSAEDVWFMKQMFPKLIQGLKGDNQYELYLNARIPFMQVLWKMERHGVRIDIEALNRMEELAKEEAENFKYRMFKLLGSVFNPDSSQHLYEVLFGFKKKVLSLSAQAQVELEKEIAAAPQQKLALTRKYKANRNMVCFNTSYNQDLVALNFGFEPTDWTIGGTFEYEELKVPKTGTDVLASLLSQDVSEEAKQFVKELMGYKKLSKLISAFMEGLREQIYEDGKVHCSFNLCGTDSWRLSSQYPKKLGITKVIW